MYCLLFMVAHFPYQKKVILLQLEKFNKHNKMMQSNDSSFLRQNSPEKTSSFIFDDLYKNAAHKQQFENNPKFSYFNAIIKMKSKLANENKIIYDRVFSSDISFTDKERRIVEDPSKETATSRFFKFSKQNSQEEMNDDKKYSITKMNFNLDHKKKGKSFYSEKPRLDDVMAQYRKMNRTARFSESKSVFSHRKNKIDPLELLKIKGGFLPKCQPKKRKKYSNFL